jgi:cell shape-determining protein MreC
MIYLQPDRKKKSGAGTFLRVLGVVLVLGIIYFFFSYQLTQALHAAQRGAAYMFGFYNDPVRPVAENSYVSALQIENDQLKDLLGRKPEKYDKELAVILSYPPRTPYDSLIVDMGEDHGLAPGDLVYADMDYLIGHVEAVYPSSSLIKLFSSPGEKVEVLVGSSSSAVIAEGRGSGNFYIKVPRNIEVKEGDPIIVPSLHALVLGSAEKVEAGEGDAYSYIYFKLPVNFNSLRHVEIKKTLR